MPGNGGARAAAVAACALVGVLVLAGCSGGGGRDEGGDAPIAHVAVRTTDDAGPYGGMTPRQELAKAEEAMRQVSAMTVDMDQQQGGRRVHLTAAITAGGGCALAEQAAGDSVQVIGTRDNTYLKADDAFWRAHGGPDGSRVAAALDGKWLRLDQRPSATEFAGYCSVAGFMSATSSNLGQGAVVRGRPATLDGKAVLTLVHTTPGHRATVRVAATGTPYILRSDISGAGGSAGTGSAATDAATESVTFSGFGRPPRISPPPPGATVALAALGVSHLSV
ncbi:hypothetical protein V2S66_14560 [Streptomyces sp. V4-01]|uniref:Lipoprotein n=1 Tax=Actinacidiphila polyblastidii TaxID=3110430 RepID=A0ABU7PDK8_9ACTN|nr:hypothetical protein [Streptomyces sp. V4-01]